MSDLNKADLYVKNLKTMAQQAVKDYADEEGDGIDQDQAVELANMFLELDRMLSSGMHPLPAEWNKTDFELGFPSDLYQKINE